MKTDRRTFLEGAFAACGGFFLPTDAFAAAGRPRNAFGVAGAAIEGAVGQTGFEEHG